MTNQEVPLHFQVLYWYWKDWKHKITQKNSNSELKFPFSQCFFSRCILSCPFIHPIKTSICSVQHFQLQPFLDLIAIKENNNRGSKDILRNWLGLSWLPEWQFFPFRSLPLLNQPALSYFYFPIAKIHANDADFQRCWVQKRNWIKFMKIILVLVGG